MSNCHIAKSSALLETLKILSQSILLFFYFQTTHLLFVLHLSHFCYQL